MEFYYPTSNANYFDRNTLIKIRDFSGVMGVATGLISLVEPNTEIITATAIFGAVALCTQLKLQQM